MKKLKLNTETLRVLTTREAPSWVITENTCKASLCACSDGCEQTH